MHKVVEVCKSELIPGGDQKNVTIEKDDIELMLPDKISNVLKKYDCDISVWEHALDIYENKAWGSSLVLKREIIEENEHLKILIFNENERLKIQSIKINDTLVVN